MYIYIFYILILYNIYIYYIYIYTCTPGNVTPPSGVKPPPARLDAENPGDQGGDADDAGEGRIYLFFLRWHVSLQTIHLGVAMF